MIDSLIAELDKETTEEKLKLMADSAEKRVADSKSVADQEALKADTEDNLVKFGDEHKAGFEGLEENGRIP